MRNQVSDLLSRFWKPCPDAKRIPVRNPVSTNCEPEDQIPVLLALSRQSDIDALKAIFEDTRYIGVPANGIDHACKVASHILFPLVVYDPFLDPAARQTAFRRMVSAWRAPSMILVCDSRVRSDEDWQPIGAFSMLCRPFVIETTIPVLDSAYLQWKSKPSAAGQMRGATI